MPNDQTKPAEQERLEIVNLSETIETPLLYIEQKIEMLLAASQEGSIISAAILKEIANHMRELALLATSKEIESETRIETIRTILQGLPTSLDDKAITIIGEYIQSLGTEPMNCGTIRNVFQTEEITLDLKDKGTVTILLYKDENGKIVAWRLNRKQTKLNKWLDRLFEHRSKGVILNKQDSEELLRVIEITEGESNSDRYKISPRRTFVEVTLFDGRKISVALAADRSNNEYVAIWRSVDRK